MRRFNAATTRRPWRTATAGDLPPRPSIGLQCGHDPKAVENADSRRIKPLPCSPASMRPRPEGRGEQSRRSRPDVGKCASMRPRPEGRGEPARQKKRRIGKRPASMRPRPEGRGERRLGLPLSASDMLQCGHDPKAVENRMKFGRGGLQRGFNAATTRRPWRTSVHRHAAHHGPSFNAATTRRPWRTTSTGDRDGGRSPRFNAATTRRPWRTAR